MSASMGPEGQERVRRELVDLDKALAAHASQAVDIRVGGSPSAKVVTLSGETVQTLRRVLAGRAVGKRMALAGGRREMTTQQAADALGVSRPHLIGLLEAGRIRYRKVGTHRRVFVDSLERHRLAIEAEAQQAADELIELSEDLGLY